MAVEVRAIGSDEFDTLTRVMGLAFGFDPREGDDRFRKILPLPRTRCAFEDGVMVGTSAAFSLEMTVPGARVPCGGTTIVSVAPTHRRRGLLRQMMRAHLDDVREHGEPIAGLWASDSAIYGRFGYGLASVSCDIEVKRQHIDLHRLAPEVRPVRMIDTDEASRLLPPFYEKVAAMIPGFFNRTPVWWENRRLADPEWVREGMTSMRMVVVDGEDGIDGFAQYRAKSDWDAGHGAGKIVVRELLGTTPESWAGLWSFVVSHDLIDRVEARLRPAWDPIIDLLAGARRAQVEVSDGLWLRIMDVPAALGARTYSAPVDLVFAVSDPLADVSGSYRLRAAEDEVECATSGDHPDIELDIEDLSACYMGRSRFRELARAGRLRGESGALAAADAAFTWDPQPWCPEIF